MAKNNWNIKISETDKPLKGFFVTVENNGKPVGAMKSVLKDFNKSIRAAEKIVISEIGRQKEYKALAKAAQALFTQEFLHSGIYKNVYAVGVEEDKVSGEPYLNVLMDTNNKYLLKLVPDSIKLPNGFEYKVVKTFSQPITKGGVIPNNNVSINPNANITPNSKVAAEVLNDIQALTQVVKEVGAEAKANQTTPNVQVSQVKLKQPISNNNQSSNQ
jgi:hypothetical protein